VPSVNPLTRAVALAACVAVIGAGAAGCETTQEKAEKQQARATHILKARAERQKEKKKQHQKSKKHHEKGKKG
jgi:uncharacterized protein HemX